MKATFPSEVEVVDGDERLKLPLTFEAISALFAKIMTDVELPKSAKKRRQAFEARVAEVTNVRNAILERGGADGDEELPDIPVLEVDDSINKERSITVAKSTVSGYKSALKLHYTERNMEFKCSERPAGSQDINSFLDDQIKSYGNLQVCVLQYMWRKFIN